MEDGPKMPKAPKAKVTNEWARKSWHNFDAYEDGAVPYGICQAMPSPLLLETLWVCPPLRPDSGMRSYSSRKFWGLRLDFLMCESSSHGPGTASHSQQADSSAALGLTLRCGNEALESSPLDLRVPWWRSGRVAIPWVSFAPQQNELHSRSRPGHCSCGLSAAQPSWSTGGRSQSNVRVLSASR